MVEPQTTLPELEPPLEKASWFLWVVLLATLVGGGMRFYGLNDGSLWIDEIYTVRDMSDFSTMERPTRYIGNLPTGVVLHLFGFTAPEITFEDIGSWREQGVEPRHIRLAPCLIGLLSIPVLAFSVRRALGARVGAVFAVLIALAPWHIYWSQLGRYYTLKFLLIALSISLYYQATRRGRIKLIIPAMICVYIAYLTHAPSAMVGLVFIIDVVIGFIRRRPIPLGRLGYAAGVLTVVAILGTAYLEQLLIEEGYSNFVGSDPDPGQSGPLLIADVAYMTQPALLLTALMGLTVLLKLRDQTQSAWYWLAAAALPVAVMAALGFMGKFAQSRYAFESLFGVLVLGAIGLAYAWRGLAPRYGRAVATLPLLLVLASMALLVAQYHTTGHHLHRRWVDAFAYIQEHRQPGENVVSPRPEIARYYLGDNDVATLPGVQRAVDRAADGKPLWVVDLGSQATGDYRWKFADDADLRAVYPIRVWQPYIELHVYLYQPRPREVWEAEERAAQEMLQGE